MMHAQVVSSYRVSHYIQGDHKSQICSLYLTVQGPPYLLTASAQKSVTIHNAATGVGVAKYDLFTTPSQVRSSMGNDLIYVSQGNRMTVLNVQSASKVMEFQAPSATHLQKMLCFGLDQNEKVIACGTRDSKVHLFDTVSRNWTPIMTLKDATDSVTSVHFVGNSIICSSLDGRIRRYDIRAGKLCVDSLPDLESIGSTAITSDESGIICSPVMEKHDTFRLLDIKTGRQLNQYRNNEFHTDGLKIDVSCSDCGNFFFSGDGHKKGVWCWDILTGTYGLIASPNESATNRSVSLNKKSGYNCVASRNNILVGAGLLGDITVWQKD